MSFFASNDRIQITNDAGQTIFDTQRPMPHILGRVQTTTSVSFPDIAGRWESATVNLGRSAMCGRSESFYRCALRFECWTEQQCGIEWNGTTSSWVCRDVQVCGNREYCSWVWEMVYYDEYARNDWFVYDAGNWETTVNLAAIPDGIDADFILVNCTATRTAQGALLDLGSIPCGLPLGVNFIANGSSIIENAATLSDGAPAMTRIMSVYVEGGMLKAHFKHSVRAFQAASRWSGTACSFTMFAPWFPGQPATKASAVSAYTFNFDVVFGKFTL